MMLLIGLNSCIGLSPKYEVTTRDCIIFKKVKVPKAVKEWFKSIKQPIPIEVITYMDDVADNNERLDEECKD